VPSFYRWDKGLRCPPRRRLDLTASSPTYDSGRWWGWVVVFVASYFSSTDMSMSYVQLAIMIALYWGGAGAASAIPPQHSICNYLRYSHICKGHIVHRYT
jgi:hypothetical protein